MYKTLSLMTILLVIVFFSCKKDTNVSNDTNKEVVTEIDRPIHLSVTKGQYGNRVIVTWTPIPKAKSYQLFKFDEVKQEYLLTKETTDTSYIDQSITVPLKKIFYKVMVYNSKNEYSKFSDIEYGYTSGNSYSKYFSFGSQGTGLGEFNFTMHVETDDKGNIYVSDEGADRVQKFDSKGNFIEVFFTGSGARAIAFLKNGNTVVTRVQSSSYVKIIDPQKNVLKEWGTYGTADNQFQNIEEITIDDEQNIYVVDGQNNAVKKFDQNGNLLLKFTAAVKTENQNDGPYPYGICFFKDKIFVTSARNSLIRIFDKKGKFLTSWDAGTPVYAIKAKGEYLYLACAGFIMKTDEGGQIRDQIGKAELSNSSIPGLAVNNNGEIIAIDVYARKIIVFKQL